MPIEKKTPIKMALVKDKEKTLQRKEKGPPSKKVRRHSSKNR